ncbi:hypothetical protein HPB47_025900, partial [Ixodes persulcatus]
MDTRIEPGALPFLKQSPRRDKRVPTTEHFRTRACRAGGARFQGGPVRTGQKRAVLAPSVVYLGRGRRSSKNVSHRRTTAPTGWRVGYTYVLHTICYVMDLQSPLLRDGNPYGSCEESWKYKLELRGRVGLERRPDATVMALVHAPGTFSGGLPRTLMMAGRHSYVLYAYQTDVFTLPLPYETACTDYQVRGHSWVQTPRTQEEECEETCMQGVWRKWCGCVSASYMLRHRVDVPICSNIAR